MLTRREFLKLASMAGIGVALADKLYLLNPEKASAAILQYASPSLDATSIPKYLDPLVIPPPMPLSGLGGPVDKYVIAVRQFTQQILPSGGPQTTVWGYGSPMFPATFNFPSFTIEATWNKPVEVQWINELVDKNGNYLPHILPVDPTLHWANPPGGEMGRDTRPDFKGLPTPDPYTGPVPIVTHVHGAHTHEESDGYAEAWYLPDAKNIPAGYATAGTFYKYFAAEAFARNKTPWPKGGATFTYPNNQRATTLWYHDHTLGMTRVNVYAGPAGFYILRGGPDDKVLDNRTGKPAKLPGPAPALGDAPGKKYYEIPIAIQDRSFNADGSLFFPDSRAFFDEATATDPGYIPNSDISPIWNPEFFGNTMVVNGRTWPYLTVEQRRYRFRMLNGCNSRFLILDFSQIPGVEVWQIGAEGGFLKEPFDITGTNSNQLLLGLAERADLIVDFTKVSLGNYTLGNLGPDEPFGGGEVGTDFDPADPGTTGQIMQFRVVATAGKNQDTSTPPQYLQLPAFTPVPATANVRKLSLNEMMSMYGWDGPAEALLGTMENGNPVHKHWMDPITENPGAGTIEEWEFYNFTADAHPIHIHLVQFQVINREGLELNDDGEPETPVELLGNARPAEAWESGFKDTVIAYPGEVTRVRAMFDTPGLFVWHCHIVDHEDNEMMRPFHVGPIPPGLPGAGM